MQYILFRLTVMFTGIWYIWSIKIFSSWFDTEQCYGQLLCAVERPGDPSTEFSGGNVPPYKDHYVLVT